MADQRRTPQPIVQPRPTSWHERARAGMLPVGRTLPVTVTDLRKAA